MISSLFPIGDGKDAIRKISQILMRMNEFFANTGCTAELPAVTPIGDFFADGFNEIWPEYCDSLWVYLDNDDVYAAFNLSTYQSIGPSWRLISTVNGIVIEEVGAVKEFAGVAIPSGYLECDGAAISRSTYAALFAVIGTTFGSGNGSTTFNIPDNRGRTVLGTGTGSGLTARNLGNTGGAETHTLSIAELAAHDHDLRSRPTTGGNVEPPFGGGGSPSAGDPTAILNKGSDAPHNNMQPFLVYKKIIYAGV